MCWIVTDTLGHGFWQSCGTLNNQRTHAQIELQPTPPTVTAFDGGGGGGGGR
jgi:hypothetical protein